MKKTSFGYKQLMTSAMLNERFADIAGGSILNGFRLAKGTGNYTISLRRGNDRPSAAITNDGVRLMETTDVVDAVVIKPNTGVLNRYDVLYVAWRQDVGGDITFDYTVVEGLPGQPVNIETNPSNRLAIGQVLVRPNAILSVDDLTSFDIGVKFGTLYANGVLVNGTPILTKSYVDGENQKNKERISSTEAELIVARKTYPTLNERLNGELAQKANIFDVEQKFNLISNASPKGVYETVSALQTAKPTGDTNIYVVTSNGNWYYWSGTAWTVGGIYQSTGIGESVIRTASLDKALSELVGIEKMTLGWVRAAIQTGNVNQLASNGAVTNNMISLDKEVEISLDTFGGTKFVIAYYTATGEFTGIYSSWFTNSTTIPADNTKKIRIQTRYNDDRLNIDLNEILKFISVVKKTYSVDRLDKKVTSIDSRLGTLESGGPQIPVHWQSHIATKMNTIKTLQKSLGFNGTSFAFITDIHWDNNSKNSPSLLKKIMTDCDISYYIDGGDFASNPSGLTKQQQIDEIKLYKKAFSSLESRVVRTIGNHDDNSINNSYLQTIDDKEMYDLVFRQNSKYPHMKNGKTGEYYYIDDAMHKMRYITLNCVDIPYIKNGDDTMLYTGMTTWAFRQEQIDWFADIALNVPDSEWNVVVCSHIPINYGYIKNDSIAMNILQAFKDKTTYTGSANTGTDFQTSKTVNYTGKGGNVICWMAGHVHVDSFITLPTNITFKEITTVNDSLHVAGGAPSKTLGTSSENAFDVFTINKETRIVNVTRIGSGSDRTFTY